jgi:hypothetical protein
MKRNDNHQGEAMPNQNLIDATQMIAADAALISARRHLRSGKHYIQKGAFTAGITSLYIAAICGMRYYIAENKHCASFVKDADLWDATGLFHALARAGVFEDPLTFNRFSLMVERAVWQESFSSDANAILAEVEKLLAKLGVMPINDLIDSLPNSTSQILGRVPLAPGHSSPLEYDKELRSLSMKEG